MLINRQLSPDEAQILHTELKTTPNILGYTVAEITRFRDVLVAEDENVFAGVCVSKDLLFNWTDIAVLYVLPAFRGQGLGKDLYTAAWERAWQRKRHIYTLSRSPEVIHLMESRGMRFTRSMLGAPLAVHLHMNMHMCSRYRISEAIRKSREMKASARLVSGVKRYIAT